MKQYLYIDGKVKLATKAFAVDWEKATLIVNLNTMKILKNRYGGKGSLKNLPLDKYLDILKAKRKIKLEGYSKRQEDSLLNY